MMQIPGKKINFILILAVMVSISIGFAGNAFAMREAGGASQIWKVATLAPKGVGWAIHTENLLLPWVKETSSGDVYIKIYWGGIMGDEKAVISKMRMGQLQGGGFSGQGATLLCPEFAVMQLPFMFNDWEEVDHIKDKMTVAMDTYMDKHGFKLLLWNDQDFDQIYSTRSPLGTLAQLRRARFFTWYGRLEEEVFKAMGITPITVETTEAPTALRQNVADSAIAPALFVVGAQLYASVKYVNPVRIRYSPGPVVVTNAAWEEIPANLQNSFATDRYRLGREYNALVREDNAKGLQALIRYGIKETAMTPQEFEALKELTRPIWDEMVGVLYPRELLDELIGHLEAYRAGQNQ
jgi:TRAP-type C4-dicarboxylate transport system substrate-binding protein